MRSSVSPKVNGKEHNNKLVTLYEPQKWTISLFYTTKITKIYSFCKFCNFFFFKFFIQAVCITTSQRSLHLTCLVKHQQQQQQCSYDGRWRLHVHLFADYPIRL